MTIDDLIKISEAQPLDLSIVESVCSDQKLTVAELFDAFAHRISQGYLGGVYSWQFCDGAMNNLFSYANVGTDGGLPGYAREVFNAFDEGEFIRPNDPKDFDHELRTKQLLNKIKQ